MFGDAPSTFLLWRIRLMSLSECLAWLVSARRPVEPWNCEISLLILLKRTLMRLHLGSRRVCHCADRFLFIGECLSEVIEDFLDEQLQIYSQVFKLLAAVCTTIQLHRSF